MRDFTARLFFPEGLELFRRAFVPVLFIALLSALLQGVVEGVMPSNVQDADDPAAGFSVAFMLTLLVRSFEATAVYAVLTSRHPGANWSLGEAKVDSMSRVCLMLLALVAFVFAVIPTLGVFALPVLLMLLTLGSVAPVPMLCDRLSALAAFRQIMRLASPVFAPFFGYATLVVALEQVAGWSARAAFGEAAGDLLATSSVALVDALAGAFTAAIFVAMYFRLRGPRSQA
jgi:hypothetical protein